MTVSSKFIWLTQNLLNIVKHFVAPAFVEILIVRLEQRTSMKRQYYLSLRVSHYFTEVIDDIVEGYQKQPV